MGRHVVVLDGLLNVRHVARYALTPGTVLRVMGVLADSPFEARGILFVVAAQAKRVALFDKVRFVLVAVYLMAIEATDLAVVHRALNEVVALHPILVRRQISELIEIRGSRF